MLPPNICAEFHAAFHHLLHMLLEIQEPDSRSLCSTLVSLVSSPFSCSLESFMFVYAEHCLHQTPRAHGCFFPRSQSFPFYLLVSVRIGSRVEFPLLFTLPSGKWNYQQGWSRKCQCFTFREMKVSIDTLRLISLTLRCVAALILFWSVLEKHPSGCNTVCSTVM